MKKLNFLLISIVLLSCSHKTTDRDKSQKSHNDKFLQENLDVKLWQEKFENRDRDVYNNRVNIVKALSLKPGDSIADVGAGTGFFLKLLHDKVLPGGKVFAVEISPGFVKFLKARATKEELTNLTVIKGGLDETNLPIGSVDKVFLSDTYHHFDKPGLMLKDFKKILKPGGELVVVDFNRVEGVSRPWILKHILMTKSEYIKQIQRFGFKFSHESKIGLKENFMLHFKLP